MSAGRFRALPSLLFAVLAAASAAACTINTNASGAGSSGHVDGGGSGATGGTGSGGTAAAGGAAGSGGGGGPLGGSAGQENCLDRKDNDRNNFIDCADPACQSAGYKCEPSPPSGWEGYFRAAGAAFDTTDPPPDCPDGNPPTKYYSEPLDAICTACQCGTMTGFSCGSPHIDCSTSSSDCSGASDSTSQFSTSCGMPAQPSKLSCKLESTTATGTGTCPPSGGERGTGPSWNRWLYVCGAPNTTGAGCVPGQSCAVPGGGAYSGVVCIRKTGEQACPSGWTTQLIGYDGGTDNRTCTPCTCTPDPSTAQCSGGEYTFYDHNDCTCDWHLFCSSDRKVNSTACVDLSGLLTNAVGTPDWGVKLTAPPAPSGGSCKPSGGQPSGDFDKTGAVTYCCR